jgi:hypothetical protein
MTLVSRVIPNVRGIRSWEDRLQTVTLDQKIGRGPCFDGALTAATGKLDNKTLIAYLIKKRIF